MTKEQREQRCRELKAELGAFASRIQSLESGQTDDEFGSSRARPRRLSKALGWIPVLAGIALIGGVVFAQSKGDALFIDERGNVGIGKAANLEGFQVVLPEGARPAPGPGVTISGGEQGNARIELRNSGSGTPYLDFAVNPNTDYDGRIRLTSAGQLAVEGADLNISGKVTARMGAVPVGAIVMWSGQPSQLPPGWVLCDGRPGTPDLRGRFIVGYNPADADYARMLNTGGTAKHALTAAEMGHTHTVTHTSNATGKHDHRWAGSSTTDADTNVAVYGPAMSGVQSVNATAHENRPPYLVLAYIMYTGK